MCLRLKTDLDHFNLHSQAEEKGYKTLVDAIRKCDFLKIVSIRILDTIDVGRRLEMFEQEQVVENPEDLSYRFGLHFGGAWMRLFL